MTSAAMASRRTAISITPISQYDGLAPFHVRGGAIAPFEGIEDATGSGDLLFLERPASADNGRNVAGGPGREGVDLFVQGDNYLLSVAYTGKKTTDAATFDSQEAVVARASWLAVNTPKFKWLLERPCQQYLQAARRCRPTPTPRTSSASATGRS